MSTVNLNCKLDLKKIALHARNAEYNPKRFAAVIMRIREPRTTALIFSSGKMVCTGAKSEEDSRLAARKYARIIQKLGFVVRFCQCLSYSMFILVTGWVSSVFTISSILIIFVKKLCFIRAQLFHDSKGTLGGRTMTL